MQSKMSQSPSPLSPPSGLSMAHLGSCMLSSPCWHSSTRHAELSGAVQRHTEQEAKTFRPCSLRLPCQKHCDWLQVYWAGAGLSCVTCDELIPLCRHRS